jgi:hypothetical protein
MPEEMGKDAEWAKVQNYLGFRIRGGYQYSTTETSGTDINTVSSGFRFNDATLFYAGPVSKHFSGFIELERPGDEEIIEAVVSVGGVAGSADSFGTFRLGQFHTLTRVGYGGMDRPTGITTADALTRDLTAGGTAFKVNQDQVGLEGTYVNKNWRIIGQVLNGITAAGVTTDVADQNKNKDFALAYELMWGDIASGLTAFAYHGIQDDPAVTAESTPGGNDRLTFQRFGLTAVQDWKNGWEFQGGFVLARDDFDDSALSDIDGQGWWVEGEKYFEKLKNITLFTRYDMTDPDTDLDDNSRTKWTLGAVWPVSEWHARLALELRNITQEGGTGNPDLNAQEAAFELMLNF